MNHKDWCIEWHYQETFPKWDDRKVRGIGKMDSLMTVAQHKRIVDGLKVENERLGRTLYERNNELFSCQKERDQLKADSELHNNLHLWMKGELERLFEENKRLWDDIARYEITAENCDHFRELLVQRDAEVERLKDELIKKCQEALPRNQVCILQAVPKEVKP